MRTYTKELKSLQHPLVKYLVKLRKDKRFRSEEKRVLLEGRKILLEYPGQIEKLFVTKEAPLSPSVPPKETYLISVEMIKKISGSPAPEPYLATVPLPLFSTLERERRLLALDRLNDPGNLGTLLRTAFALGFDGAFLIEPSADPFMDKALRAAKGATFRLPMRMGTEELFISLMKKKGLLFYIGDAKGTSTFRLTSPCVLILGNESHGVSKPLKSLGLSISIPLSNAVESLNVGAAGAILMYQFQETLWPK